MSTIIHKVLFERMARHPEWGLFREAFAAVTGSPVCLVEEPDGGPGTHLAQRIELHGVYVGTLSVGGSAAPRGQVEAWRHLLKMAAERFAAVLAASHIHDREPLPQPILKTCRWIQAHALTQEVPLGEAARQCGLSPSHLSRLFHRSTGMTYQEYVTRYRLERACHLLGTTDRSVTDIAFESGFQSISQFHRSFKAIYGEKPLEFRRKSR